MKKFSLMLTFFVVIVMGVTVSAGQAACVKNLYVDNEARQYFEIVAFAPGSGWIKAKSPEVMRPLLNLNNVTPADVKRFNGYARGYGLPVRAEFSGGILHLVMNDTDIGFLTRMGRIKRNLYWEPEERPHLALIKDSSGKIFVVQKAVDIRTANRPDKNKSIRKKNMKLKYPQS